MTGELLDLNSHLLVASFFLPFIRRLEGGTKSPDKGGSHMSVSRLASLSITVLAQLIRLHLPDGRADDLLNAAMSESRGGLSGTSLGFRKSL